MSLHAGTDNVLTGDDFVTDIQTAAIDQTKRTDHVVSYSKNITMYKSYLFKLCVFNYWENVCC